MVNLPFREHAIKKGSRPGSELAHGPPPPAYNLNQNCV